MNSSVPAVSHAEWVMFKVTLKCKFSNQDTEKPSGALAMLLGVSAVSFLLKRLDDSDVTKSWFQTHTSDILLYRVRI